MTKSILAFEFFPAAAIRATPHEATPFANRGEPYLAVMGLMCDVASRDAEVRAFKRELSDYITTTCGYDGKRAPGDPAPFYLNLEQESMSPKDAFGDHVQKLRELQRKYDAENVFHEWHGVKVKVGPKLSLALRSLLFSLSTASPGNRPGYSPRAEARDG